jgi:hypothetical protein
MTSESKRQDTNPAQSREKARAAAKRAVSQRRGGGLGGILALDADRSSRLLLIGGVALVLLVAAGFVAFGYYQTVIKPRNRTVLGADGINISYSAMKRRMAYDLKTNPTYQQSQGAITTLPTASYTELLNEITLITRAPSDQGINVSKSDVDQALRSKVGVASNVSQQQFAAAFRTALDKSGLTETETRRQVEAGLIESKLRTKFTSELPATVPQAKLDVISTTDQNAANQALQRVKAGEDWATVAKALSNEPSVPTSGGTHDYAPEGEVNAAYSGFAFSAPVGATSDVINGGGQAPTYYVVRVVDRADKALTEQQKPAAVDRRYNQWLDDMHSKMQITNHWDATTQTKALISVVQSTPLPTQAVPVQQPTVSSQVIPPAQPTPASNTNPVVPNAPVAPGSPSAP